MVLQTISTAKVLRLIFLIDLVIVYRASLHCTKYFKTSTCMWVSNSHFRDSNSEFRIHFSSSSLILSTSFRVAGSDEIHHSIFAVRAFLPIAFVWTRHMGGDLREQVVDGVLASAQVPK